MTVSRKIWKLMIGILNVYLVTNLLYPGVASIIKTSWPNGWLSVALVFAFNAWDFGGTVRHLIQLITATHDHMSCVKKLFDFSYR